ncbi:hypothetical protein ACTQW9_12335 [Lachnospiraceae bacterium LCP19S3_B12]
MRDQYWNFYVSLKYKEFYYKWFRSFWGRINWGISCFCTLISLSCVAAWGVWKMYPVLWTVLICVSQVIQVLFPKLPYNDLLSASKLITNPLDRLLLDLEHSWLQMNYTKNFSDNEILDLLHKYKLEYSELVTQFFSASYLTNIKWCENKAEKDCKNYFLTTYPSQGGSS